MTPVTQITVEADEAGMRFDRWAKKRFPTLAFGQLQRLLRTGQFRLDGRRIEAGQRLEAGQTVRVPPLPAAEGEADRPGPARSYPRQQDAAFVRSLVVYEDEEIIALDKPPGLAVQGGTNTTRHLDALLETLARGGEKPRLVHRLDRDTSGLIVVARTAPVARELTFAFQQHGVRKLYWAVLVKGPERNHGRIDLPLGKVGGAGREKMAVDPEEGGQFARTAFKVLARAGKVAAWTALLPLTGRTHQLRAHCNAVGAPILGDGKYGGRAAHPEGAPKGLMLHARELEIPRRQGRPLRLVADPPRPFAEALAWLGLDRPELPGATLDEWTERDLGLDPARASRSGGSADVR